MWCEGIEEEREIKETVDEREGGRGRKGKIRWKEVDKEKKMKPER